MKGQTKPVGENRQMENRKTNTKWKPRKRQTTKDNGEVSCIVLQPEQRGLSQLKSKLDYKELNRSYELIMTLAEKGPQLSPGTNQTVIPVSNKHFYEIYDLVSFFENRSLNQSYHGLKTGV